MTRTTIRERPATETVLRDARRAWYLAGVRRRDRAALTSELRNELALADDIRDVVGDDPAITTRDWAAERGITDRRCRLLVVVPAALVPAALVASGVLALLYQAFTANGNTLLNRISGPARVATYIGTGVVAYLAMLVGVAAALRCVGDTTEKSTVRVFAVTLPVGAVLATVGGVATAAAQHFDTDRHAATLDIGAVLITLILVIAASRLLAVNLAHRHGSLVESPETGSSVSGSYR